MSDLNLQPVLDLLAKAGEETSEFKKAKAAGTMAMILFALGLVGLIAGVATNAFGDNSKVGIVCTALASVAGVIAKAMVSMGYSSARADTKTAAAEMASQIATVQASTATVPAIKVQ